MGPPAGPGPAVSVTGRRGHGFGGGSAPARPWASLAFVCGGPGPVLTGIAFTGSGAAYAAPGAGRGAAYPPAAAAGATEGRGGAAAGAAACRRGGCHQPPTSFSHISPPPPPA